MELPSLRSTLHLHFIHTDFQLPHTHKGYERGRASEREREKGNCPPRRSSGTSGGTDGAKAPRRHSHV